MLVKITKLEFWEIEDNIRKNKIPIRGIWLSKDRNGTHYFTPDREILAKSDKTGYWASTKVLMTDA